MFEPWSDLSHQASRRTAAGTVRCFGSLACLLWTLSGSSALAQVFPPPARPATYLSASGTMAVGFPSTDAAVSGEPASNLPASLAVSGDLRTLMERMWATSSTFRRQCARLAESAVTVTVEIGYARVENTIMPRPLTRIRMVEARLTATVRLGEGQYDYSEFVAHEIEHILEQLDGVDLGSALARGLRGVHLAGAARIFETDRATAVGRLVAREVNRGR